MPTDSTGHTDRSTADANDTLLERFRSEMRHAPGLALTLAQTARLFNLRQDACERLVAALAEEGRLYIRPDGRIISTPVK
jgi:hypothetical protein